MGQIAKSQALTSYRDDDVASTSSAVPLQHQRYADEDVPPAYAEEADVFGVPQESRINGEPTLTRPSHVEGGSFGFKVHEDSKGSFTTYISDALSSDPEICQSLVERETQRSPIPMVRIIGSHVETRQRDKKEEKQRVTDFDVSAHMSGLLAAPWARSKVVENSQKTYRGGIVRQVDPRLKAHPEAANTPPSLKEWCHRFCASSASAKSFKISRHVTGVEYHTLTQQLTAVIRCTNYRGHISITYPVRARATFILSNHWLNRYRHNKFIWWACVLLQLWIFTWPLLFFMTKRWEVFSVEWPCRIYQNVDGSWPSDQRTDTDWVQEGHPTDNRLVRIANMSELDWVQRWKLAIQMAAESKQQGTLTEADRCVAQAIEERSRQSSTVVNHDVSLRSAPGILSGIQELITQHQTLRGWGGDC